MARLVHLVGASRIRTIERAGIRGGRASVIGPSGEPSPVERAVYAMPIVPDFSVTYQWVRELRRWHGERLVAVHFVVPSDEPVLVGRYDKAHARLRVRDAIREVLQSPAGNEIVVPRSVPRRDVVGFRTVVQLVGWTGAPESSAKFDCLCQACVAPGTRDLMRKVRGEFSRRLLDARSAMSPDAVVAALRCLETPLERARGRIEPNKLLAFARAESAEVRQTAAWLLGYFRWTDVEATLSRLSADADERVSACAIESLVRAGGVRRAYERLRGSHDAVVSLVDHLQYERDVVLSAHLLSVIAARHGEDVRARAAEIATELLREDELDPATTDQLRAVASGDRSPGSRHFAASAAISSAVRSRE